MRRFFIHTIFFISLLASSCSDMKVAELRVSFLTSEEDYDDITGEKSQALIKMLDEAYITSSPYIEPVIKLKRNNNRQNDTSRPAVYLCRIREMPIVEIYDKSEIVYELCRVPDGRIIIYKGGDVDSPHVLPSDFIGKLRRSICEK